MSARHAVLLAVCLASTLPAETLATAPTLRQLAQESGYIFCRHGHGNPQDSAGQLAASSDVDGLVSFQPPPSDFPDAVVEATAVTGIAALPLQLQGLPAKPIQVAPAKAPSAVETDAAKRSPREKTPERENSCAVRPPLR